MAGLSLGLGLGLSNGRKGATSNPLCEAIAKKVCVVAVFKGKDMRFAPHVVYGTGDNLSVDGVVVEYGGKKPNKPKIETFTVSDLESVQVSEPAFTPHAGFDPNDPEYAGKVVCVVQLI